MFTIITQEFCKIHISQILLRKRMLIVIRHCGSKHISHYCAFAAPQRLKERYLHDLSSIQDPIRYPFSDDVDFARQHGPDSRELADMLGISLAELNYCLNALIDKVFVKMGKFRKATASSSAYI